MITLRKIEQKDTEYIISWRNNPAVKKYFINREVNEAIHRKWIEDYVNTQKAVQFIIEDEGRPIGSTFLRDIDTANGSAEFGIFIGEDDARGKGLGIIATKKTIEYGFSELKLNRIILRVLSENTKAQKCYQKAGFIYEETAKQMVFLDDEYKDVVFMAIIKKKS